MIPIAQKTKAMFISASQITQNKVNKRTMMVLYCSPKQYRLTMKVNTK